jgi:hypothetical protein
MLISFENPFNRSLIDKYYEEPRAYNALANGYAGRWSGKKISKPAPLIQLTDMPVKKTNILLLTRSQSVG